MQFEMVRLSVLPRPQMDGFERKKADGRPFTREEWLRAVFSERLQFIHRNEIFHYVPAPADKNESLVVGRIGREVTVPENEDPDRGLGDIERIVWRAALVVIDPTHHADGQKAAVAHLSQIGRPVALFESLSDTINNRIEPFLIESNAIVPSETFWSFVAENKGRVTSLEFEFVAPNMFGGSDDYDKEMKELQEYEKVQKAKLKLESKDGLVLDTDKVKAAADYTLRGTGSIKAKTNNNKQYNSKASARVISIPRHTIEELPQEGLLHRLARLIFPS